MLRSADATGASVRYAKHALEGEDIQLHLRSGKQVRQLAMNWQDRVDFILNESLQLTRLNFDVATEMSEPDTNDDPFDATAALTLGELSRLLPALMEGLGGRVSGLGGPAEGATPAASAGAHDQQLKAA